MGWFSRSLFHSEREVLALRLVGANRNRRRLRPEPLVPGSDLVGPRVEAIERELPVRASHREEGMSEDADVSAHPWVDVALDLEHRLRLGERRGHLLDRR